MVERRLWAISDLHVGDPKNRRALEGVQARPDDWLILAGDLGETEAHLELAFAALRPRFARVLWTPGNHELWSLPGDPRGVAKYERAVEVARRHDVLTPEDEYPLFESGGERAIVAPLFLLYDYTFRPDHVPEAEAVAWAAESGVVCADEELLWSDPYRSREAWCAARCDLTEARLAALPGDVATILVNHFPLRRDHAILPAIPRFAIWCGTRRTEDWHVRFRARVVVSGHLHVRTTRWLDGTRFEEVSLGYSRQWSQERGLDAYLKLIAPSPAAP